MSNIIDKRKMNQLYDLSDLLVDLGKKSALRDVKIFYYNPNLENLGNLDNHIKIARTMINIINESIDDEYITRTSLYLKVKELKKELNDDYVSLAAEILEFSLKNKTTSGSRKKYG